MFIFIAWYILAPVLAKCFSADGNWASFLPWLCSWSLFFTPQKVFESRLNFVPLKISIFSRLQWSKRGLGWDFQRCVGGERNRQRENDFTVPALSQKIILELLFYTIPTIEHADMHQLGPDVRLIFLTQCWNSTAHQYAVFGLIYNKKCLHVCTHTHTYIRMWYFRKMGWWVQWDSKKRGQLGLRYRMERWDFELGALGSERNSCSQDRWEV